MIGSHPHGFLYVVLSDHLSRALHVPLQTADQLSGTQQTLLHFSSAQRTRGRIGNKIFKSLIKPAIGVNKALTFYDDG